jgi:hypothetical protein
MRSEAEIAVETLNTAKEFFLPERGAEFVVTYYRGDQEVSYAEKGHTWANAVSPGLKMIVMGEDARISQKRQKQPSLGLERTMLCANLGDVWIHVLGDLIVVAREKLNVGQIVKGAEPWPP